MIKPINKRILVEKEIEPEKKTAAGIIVPESAKEKPTEGVVLEVADDCEFVKREDRIIFNEYGPDNIKYGGREYFILNEDVVLAIVKQ